MQDPAIHYPQKTYTAEEAMALPRAQRRALAKQNGIKKIPGSNNAHLKNQIIKRLRDKNMPEPLVQFYIDHDRIPTEEEFKKIQEDESKNT